MNKTISITLGGLIFNIDDEAYLLLKNYLTKLQLYFQHEEGASEIIQDIEARIAEIFTEALSNNKQVIEIQDVNNVIEQLGQPQDMLDDDLADEYEEAKNDSEKEYKHVSDQKKMFRNPEDSIIAGVCSGLAAYLGVDAVWLRLFFIAIALFFGNGIILYIILWIAIPEAKSTADKLRMHGKPININNIEETIKKEFNHIKDGISGVVNDKDVHSKVRNAGNVISNIIESLVRVLLSIIKVFSKIIAYVIIVVGFISIFGLFVTFLAFLGIIGGNFNELATVFFNSTNEALFGGLNLFFIVLLPILLLMLLAFKILLNNKYINSIVLGALFALWVVAIGTLVVQALWISTDFETETYYEETLNTKSIPKNRLYITQLSNDNIQTSKFNRIFARVSTRNFYTDDQQLYYKNGVKLIIEKSDNPFFSIEKRVQAKGRNYDVANNNTQYISTETQLNDSLLQIDPWIQLPLDQKWRAQRVIITIKVPVGAELVFLNNLKDVNKSIPFKNSNFYRISQKTFYMSEFGLYTNATNSNLNADKHDQNDYKTIQLDEFSKLKIESRSKINIEFKIADNYEIKIHKSINNELDNKININNRSNELQLEIDELYIHDNSIIQIVIFAPYINQLDCDGKGNISINAGTIDYFEAEFDGVYTGDITGDFNLLEIDSEGFSNLNLSGTANKLKLDLAGKSSTEANHLISNMADIEATGVSSAILNVNEQLKVNLKGSSSVQYKGNPQIESKLTGISTIYSIN